ncbi:type II secretion system F family protein [Enterobacteriaceae bacterium H20N1]|uniref:Type II secretion system F family protein n=1 Tax=Dryocola boscaweniae TaxID=2925397 RepID=A0A9X2W466_9ENTR|nr:type II secretion system F family protein [Dryocola boscaweniae]MCT4700539.1 type II secretion system F family protein [Dryocola boscaweniae]MCT4717695.1 type II secretion system F family protein [Dryocola boscaweniae]
MLNELNDYLAPVNRYLTKLSFTGSTRLDFYRSLLLLLDNQVRLNEALAELYTVYSNYGKRKNAPVAVIIDECLKKMNEGESFSEALSRWLPVEEGMLLHAGEMAGKLGKAFNEAEKIMAARKRIIGAIAGALAYPLLLFVMMGFLLHMIATDLVPKLARVVDPAKWNGSAGLLRDMAFFVTQYGVVAVMAAVVISILIAISLPLLRGKLRILLDTIPPWSIYRLVHGTTFLLNIGSLIKSGMRLNTALDKLSVGASPWLTERIEATRDGLTEGKNFGEALISSGYNFPDQKANRFLAVISAYSGIDNAIIKFSNRWLDETVNKIQSVAKIMLMSGVAGVGIIMLLVIAGAGGIQDAIQASVG